MARTKKLNARIARDAKELRDAAEEVRRKEKFEKAHEDLIGEIHESGLEAHRDCVNDALGKLMGEAERLYFEAHYDFKGYLPELWKDINRVHTTDEEDYVRAVLDRCKSWNGPIYRKTIAEVIVETTRCGDCGMVPCRCYKWAIKVGSKTEGYRYFPKLFMRREHAKTYAKVHNVRAVRIHIPDRDTLCDIEAHAEKLANLSQPERFIPGAVLDKIPELVQRGYYKGVPIGRDKDADLDNAIGRHRETCVDSECLLCGAWSLLVKSRA